MGDGDQFQRTVPRDVSALREVLSELPGVFTPLSNQATAALTIHTGNEVIVDGGDTVF
ncbi:hypothetical protein ACL02T_17385 [Pseudonocardia sp. RS010]|uniref:hypothetical protein n=1 Tax=Pseudonocardia sp. RS010 TaxID=3385979 RepID=UPI0039A272F5